jgi:hypothetical protein
VASFKATFEDGSIDSTEEVVTGLTGVATGVGALALAWPKVKSAFEGIAEFFRAAKQMAPEVGWLAALFPKLSGAFASFSSSISGAASSVGTFLGGITAAGWGIIAAVIVAVISLIVFLKRNWEELGEVVKNFFNNNILPKLESMKESFEKAKKAILDALPPEVIQWFKDAVEWIKKIVGAIVEWVKSVEWLKYIGTFFEAIGGVLFGQLGGLIAAGFSGLVQFVQGLVKLFSGLIQFIVGFVEFWIALFKGDNLVEPLKKMWAGIKDVFVGMYDMTIGVVVDFVKSVIDWFTELWDVIVGHSIVPDMVNAIVDWFLSLPGKILKPIQDFVNNIIKKFKDMWDSIKSWWKSSVAPKFTESYWKDVFNKVVSGASKKLGEIKGEISKVWDGVKSWFNSNVAPKLTLDYWKEKFNNIVQGIKDKWTEARNWWNSNKPTLNTVSAAIASIKDALSGAWDTARNWWNNNKPTLNSISVAIDSIKEKLKSAWETAKDWLDQQSMKLDIKTPHFSVGWNYDIADWMATAANFLFDRRAIPYIDVQWYAQGGYPGMGEMFVAREAGPELVGRIGSRTAVVNNDQIVEAVSRGVYDAVVAAMGSSSGAQDQAINVYLDGKQITAAVEKRQRERGATLMTGGMAYGY